MKYHKFQRFTQQILNQMIQDSTYKYERIITTPQSAKISTKTHSNLLNFCSNNYLGLCNDPRLIKRAKESLEKWGYGLSSVRFICGTTEKHLVLEKLLSEFYETEDTIIFSSCFDANEAIFEALLTEEDAIVSDKLNHASIINGIRLSKAARFLYENNNMADLEQKLKSASNARFRILVTDGVFSMDGEIANIQAISSLAEKYDSLLMIDESHGTGVIGKRGRGAIEFNNSMGSAEIISSTFGKALGGGNGGFITGKKVIIDLLRQKARPYLFSNSLPTHVVETYIESLSILGKSTDLIEKLAKNIHIFRTEMKKLGFNILGNENSAICPVLFKDAKITVEIASQLMSEGIYVIGFCYPVVPKDLARIRVQMSAGHSENDIRECIRAFEKVGRKMKAIC